MHKYEIIIYWSNEDDAYVAEVPELPGCMAHGNAYEYSTHRANVATVLTQTALLRPEIPHVVLNFFGKICALSFRGEPSHIFC